MKIKQVYTPYWEWEDFLHGMWRSVSPEEEAKYLVQAIFFTANFTLYGYWMQEAAERWPRTMLNSLTNPSINKRAFVGHCACSLAFNCPEYIVRMAWKQLTEQQRTDADAIAQKIVDEWKEKYARTFEHGNSVAIQNYPTKRRPK